MTATARAEVLVQATARDGGSYTFLREIPAGGIPGESRRYRLDYLPGSPRSSPLRRGLKGAAVAAFLTVLPCALCLGSTAGSSGGDHLGFGLWLIWTALFVAIGITLGFVIGVTTAAKTSPPVNAVIDQGNFTINERTVGHLIRVDSSAETSTVRIVAEGGEALLILDEPYGALALADAIVASA